MSPAGEARQPAAQPAVPADRFACEIVKFLKVSPSALAAAERQTVGPWPSDFAPIRKPCDHCILIINFLCMSRMQTREEVKDGVGCLQALVSRFTGGAS